MNSAQPLARSAQHRKWPWIVGGSLVAAMLVACGSGGSSSSDSDSAGGGDDKPAATKKAEAKKAGLNTAVRDGKFEFTVTKAKCGSTKVGSDLIGEKAQGQYCLITVKVKNIGKEAQAFTDSSQKAYDAKKVEYSVDSAAAIYVNSENQVLFQDINPGNSVTGTLVFDVPKNTKLTSLELHDSIFSGGVEVALQ